MIYDAFAHLPLYGLEDLGFVGRGEAAAFIAERNTAPGGKLPLNTNGGGFSYTHTGMYGMFALQESVRQVRGHGAGAGQGRPGRGLPRRRRHVRRERHDRDGGPAALTRVSTRQSTAEPQRTQRAQRASAGNPFLLCVLCGLCV